MCVTFLDYLNPPWNCWFSLSFKFETHFHHYSTPDDTALSKTFTSVIDYWLAYANTKLKTIYDSRFAQDSKIDEYGLTWFLRSLVPALYDPSLDIAGFPLCPGPTYGIMYHAFLGSAWLSCWNYIPILSKRWEARRMLTTYRRTISRFESSMSSQMLNKVTPSTLVIIMYGDPTPPLSTSTQWWMTRGTGMLVWALTYCIVATTDLQISLNYWQSNPLLVGTGRGRQARCDFNRPCEGSAQHCNLPRIDYPSGSQKPREVYMRWKRPHSNQLQLWSFLDEDPTRRHGSDWTGWVQA